MAGLDGILGLPVFGGRPDSICLASCLRSNGRQGKLEGRDLYLYGVKSQSSSSSSFLVGQPDLRA